MINGAVIPEIFQLISVLFVLVFTIGGIYLMQRYTGA